jgi:signal transduction histidine kinase
MRELDAFDIGALLIVLTTVVLVFLLWRQARGGSGSDRDQTLLRPVPPNADLFTAPAISPAVNAATRIAGQIQGLSGLVTHLQQRQEDEKRRLAQRLHGELGSTLIAVKMDIEGVEERLRQTEPELVSRLARAQHTLQQAVAINRGIIDALRPTLLENLGFAAAVEWEVAEVGRRAGLNASATVAAEMAELPEPMAMSLFRAVQEALNNSARHAQARNLWVEIAVADSNISILVEDDGIGITDGVLYSNLSHGLAGIRQRAQALRGECLIRRGPDGGTVVELNIPVPAIPAAGN